MATFLVTGGAGYVGSALVHRLHQDGAAVVVVDDLRQGRAQALPSGVKLIEARVADTAAYEHVLRSTDLAAVFHFAASSLVGASVKDPLAYYDNNVRETMALLSAMKDRPVPFVLSSTASIYGSRAEAPIMESSPAAPENPYGETKRVLESMLHWCEGAYGQRWVALRYFNAAGAAPGLVEHHDPETHLIPNVLRALRSGEAMTVHGTDYPTSDGTAVRDYVHILDLAEGHVGALRYLQGGGASRVFNLGSGKGVTVREVMGVFERLSGETVPWCAGPRRAGDPPVLVAAIDAARTQLGFAPRRSDIETIVSDVLAYSD